MANVTNQNSYTGTSGADSIAGTAGNDTLAGGAGNDTIDGLGGKDTLTGGLGKDTVVFAGVAADYRVTKSEDGSWLVTDINTANGNEGQKVVSTVEVLRFSDQDWFIQAGYGSVGAEFRVNTATAQSQYDPSVAALSNGGFVVTWRSDDQDTSASGIYAQRYSADGTKAGDEFLVNSMTANDQIQPSALGIAGGGFVITWSSLGQDGSDWGVYAQRYTNDGLPAGSEFLINTNTNYNQYQPAVAALAGGGFVATWNSDLGGSWEVYAKLFSASGQVTANEFRVNTETSGGQIPSAVAALAQGGFAATWVSDSGQDGASGGIYAQRYLADGNADGSEFKVNTTTAGNQYQPDICALAEGGFVVVWSSEQAGLYDVYAQKFGSDGQTVGSEFKVNNYGGSHQWEASVVGVADGGFAVTWRSDDQDGSGTGVYGRLYTQDGLPFANEFRINTTTQDSQHQPDVVALADGGFVVAWQAWNQDGSALGVYAQRYQLGGTFLVAGNTVVGSDAADFLQGGAGNHTIVGGLGNDTVDGGAGINTYRVRGTEDGFYWSVNARGEVVLTDSIADDPKHLADTSDEGVDTLRNIQAIEFVLPDGTISSVTALDDFGNAPDASNYQIQYGVWVNGRANFYGDVDYFKLQTTAGQKVLLEGNQSTTSGRLLDENSNSGIQGNETYLDRSSTRTLNWNSTGLQDIHWNSYELSASSPMASKSYGFVFRRELDGSDAADTLTAGTQYEYLAGGMGNDTLTGSDRSDRLEGGDGNDLMTGGKGYDQIEGGSGASNIAQFTGKKADYSFTWLGSNDLGLTITDSVQGRDGSDQLRNVQILRFADGDVVLDAESNVNVRAGAIDVGQKITGSLPLGVWGWIVDQDYFLQKLPSSVTTSTNLRLTVSRQDTSQIYSDISVRFFLQGTTDVLTFKDKGTAGGSISEFRFWGSQSSQSWFIAPSRVGNSDYIATGQPLDVYVNGWAGNNDGIATALGETLAYTIRLDRVLLGTTGADTLQGDGVSGYIDAAAGSDSVTGSANDEQILGGLGDDTLDGAGGDDVLADSSGRNVLKGGDGNDVFDLTDGAITGGLLGSSPTDTIDGGTGTDTLKIASDTNWAGLSVSNVEVLDGSGGRTNLTPEQIQAKGFSSATNLTVRLDPTLSTGGMLDAGSLAGNFAIRGTNQSDLLKGNSDNNVIYLGAEEALGSGYGADTVQAGAGDDQIILSATRIVTRPIGHQIFSKVDFSTRTYIELGQIDGGVGFDTVVVDLSIPWWAHAWGGDALYYSGTTTPVWYIDLSQWQLNDVEKLEIRGDPNPNMPWTFPTEITLSTKQIQNLSTASGFKSVAIVGGGTLDLGKLASLSISNWHVADTLNYSITGTQYGDSVSLSSGTLNASLGDGQDEFVVDGKALVNDTLDGGQGSDTLTIRGADVDLSGATLVNIESINVASQSLSMTQSQWASYGSMVHRVTGSGSTAYILSFTDASTITLEDTSPYVGLTGSSGADRITGNAQDNILVGGAGSDVLFGLAGNDRLVTGEGADTLYGGEGNDTLVVTGKLAVMDQLSGGAGVDTLQVQDGQDYSLATLSDLEMLTGAGTITMKAAQVANFQRISGVSVQLSGTSAEFDAGTVQLLNGAKVLLPQVDTQLNVSVAGVMGSKGDDVITGGPAADAIWGGRGADYIAGGLGADTLAGGSGVDTLVGGEGDDTFRVDSAEFDAASNNLVNSDIVIGGEGSDVLEINFANSWKTFAIAPGAISSVEALNINDFGNWNSVTMDAETFRQFSTVNIFNLQGSYGDRWTNINIAGDGGDINFDAISGDSKISKLYLTGNNADIDARKLNIGPQANVNDPGNNSIYISALDSVLLGAGNDRVRIQNDGQFTANLGAGDDQIWVENVSKLSATIDGGAGSNTLNLSNNTYADLSGATLTNIGNIVYGSANLVVSQAQLDSLSLSFDGTGAKFVRKGNLVVGSAAADTYNGDGTGSFSGGAGNDTINNIDTAVFTGNHDEYAWKWVNGAMAVEHIGGSKLDGKDTLNGVMNLLFADSSVPVEIDDAPNNIGSFIYSWMGSQRLSMSALTDAQYGKPINGKKDYASDTDVFKATLVPNSPLSIDGSSFGGNGWGMQFYDAKTAGQITFKSLLYPTWLSGEFNNSMTAAQKWLPGFNSNEGFVAYQGGEVIFQVNVHTDANSATKGITDYAFTLNYLDDYEGNANTQGVMNSQTGDIKGYIGDINDSDWIRTQLIAGTKYEFNLKGASSGGGSLMDPQLQLLDEKGNLVEAGASSVGDVKAAGTDDVIQFQATTSGTYYLAVSDVAGVNKGSWTLTQKSLDTVPGNESSAQRLLWSENKTFSETSEINILSDHDWFQVWLDKGITYDFRAQGTSAGATLSDPQLALRSVTGILLAQNDNGGLGTDSRLFYSAADSGWYYLDVGASGNASKGTYVIRGSTLNDDYSNDRLTTGNLQVGQTIKGLVTYVGDTDWFSMGLSKGTTYVINLVGDKSDGAQLDPLNDPLMQIRDAQGNVLARFDDFNGSLDARAYFSPTASGKYYLEAKSAFKYDIGAYALSLELAPPDDHADMVGSSATALTLGIVANGSLGIPGDRDMFKLALEANKVYQIGVGGMAASAGTLIDPFVRVFDAQGRLLDFDNNGGLGNDAKFYFVPKTSDVYYVEASSNNDKGMGTYQVLAVQRDLPADEARGDIGTTTFLQPGDTFNGNLLTKNDQDWFGIKLVAGQSYAFDLRASHSGNGTLQDPLLAIYKSDGTPAMPAIEGTLISNEPSTAFTPTVSGTYYLAVKASDGANDSGTYTLVTRAPDDYANSKAGATTITLNQSLDGSIQWSNGAFGARAMDSIGLATDRDSDWFKMSAQQGEVLSFSVEATSGSTLSRPMVEIVDDNIRSVAVADGLETANGLAVATFRAGAAGTFYARVIDGAGSIGAYRVTLAAGDASDEDASGAVKLNFAASATTVQAQKIARIGLAGDTDTFTLDMLEGHTYRIETLAVRDGRFAPLPSAAMTLAYQVGGDTAVGTVEVQTAVGTPSLYDVTQFLADKAGSMQITVAPLDSTQTGQYKVRVTDLGVSQEDDRPDVVKDYVDATDRVMAGNDSREGKIDGSGDIDLFAINLTKGNIYDFSLKGFGDQLGTLAQAEVRLLDEKGNLVTTGTFDLASGRTELSLSVFDSGRYYVAVSAADVPGNTGTYVLDTRLRDTNSNPSDDLRADTRSGVNVAPGAPAKGVINFDGDQDWIHATLTAGKVYVVDALAAGAGASNGTLQDATLRLLDSEGNVVAWDDDSGAGLDSHIQFTVNTTGDYYVDIGSNDGNLGSYTVRLRELYSGIADPLKGGQWYLTALGLDALGTDVSGAGITVGVVDDGIDYSHPDLTTQINKALGYDTQFSNSQTPGDGQPKYPNLIGLPPDDHGTAVAGIIAAQGNNETGIVGIAPDAKLVSTRVKWSWDQITEALSLQHQFDVSNNSWGAIDPFGDNFNSTALTFAYQALRTGVEEGRNGLGTVFVFSAGNSASSGDNTNYHNFQNAREVISVGAAEADGSTASFTTPGANVLVGTYGVGLLTTDRHQKGWGYNSSSDYTNFSGTSAAAPVVSGVVALMLEANSKLGYRDVQEILAYTASHPDNQDWKVNAASNWNFGGLKFNDNLGFGLVDARAAVTLAQTWTQVSHASNEVSASARAFNLNAPIPDGSGAYSKTFTIDANELVEHVELGVDLRHTRLGDITIELISPNGTVSTLMNRPTVNAEQPFGLSGTDSGVPTHLLWDFSSVQFWGEEAAGTWTVSIKDVRAEETGTLQSLSLRIYGAQDTGDDTYVLTDEAFSNATTHVLNDESGHDVINASTVTSDMSIDLAGGLMASKGVIDTISSWTVIEDLVTGSGNDRLTGNAANNLMQGRDGNDTMEGGVGKDSLIGGGGSDAAVYRGNLADFKVVWNATSHQVTVLDTNITDGLDEGFDTLSGIERLVFNDGEMNLSQTVGNRAPVADTKWFDKDVKVTSGMGINFEIPATAFTDADNSAESALTIQLTDQSGGSVPQWLSYDQETQTISGVPPENFQGQLKLLVTAIDEFGQSASDVLTLQFGDNQAPILDAPSVKSIQEDDALVSLGIGLATDPEQKAVSIKITEIPTLGALLDKTGNTLTVGMVLTADALTEVHYQSQADANGDAGMLRYEATDEDGVTASSSISLMIQAVNDAPRFSRANSTLVIQYPSQNNVQLDIATPSDPESVISSLKVMELPALGQVRLAGTALVLNQVLTLSQASALIFNLSENINGPIGRLSLQARDDAGLTSDWSLNLQVLDASYSSKGTDANDQIYGSTLADTLYGFAGDDALVGNAGDDRLLGGLGNDSLYGGTGNDSLDGSSGNDYVDGGAGNDLMAGGPGNDTYMVDSLGDTVLEVISSGAGGKDLVVTSVTLSAPTNVENLQASAGAAINLTGNELDNILVGNELANILSGAAGRDTLSGGAGDDVLNGGAGVDRMAGGAGNDTYYVDSRLDVVVELTNEGADSVLASASYTLTSNIENLTLQEGGDWTAAGNSLDNYIKGNSGNNLLSGGLGRDTLDGGAGNDIYILNDKLDVIIDSAGNDTIRSTLDIILPSIIENGELIGIADTYLTGNAAANNLQGNSGDNVLDGLDGADTLTGGAGSDQFVISKNIAVSSADSITDFLSATDLLVINLQSFGVNPVALGLSSSGTLNSASFVKGAGAVALDKDDYFLLDTAQGVLKFDADGSGSGAAVDLVKFVGVLDSHFAATDIYMAI